jgi:hypothetical protein
MIVKSFLHLTVKSFNVTFEVYNSDLLYNHSSDGYTKIAFEVTFRTLGIELRLEMLLGGLLKNMASGV